MRDWKSVRDNRKFEITEFEISDLFLLTLYRGFAGDLKTVRDKREFEITEFEITGFYCMSKNGAYTAYTHRQPSNKRPLNGAIKKEDVKMRWSFNRVKFE